MSQRGALSRALAACLSSWVSVSVISSAKQNPTPTPGTASNHDRSASRTAFSTCSQEDLQPCWLGARARAGASACSL